MRDSVCGDSPLARLARFERAAFRLGGGRSIQLSYGNIFKIYSILVLNLLNVNRLCPKGGRYNIFLGEAPEGHF